MTSRDFCFWLQGYLEVAERGMGHPVRNLTEAQVECIQKHLAMVFAHDIDPQVPPKVAEVLDAIHQGGKPHPLGPQLRC